MASKAYGELSVFFAQPVCVSALSTLAAGAQMRIAVGETEAFTLKKEPLGAVLIENEPLTSPDLSFSLSLSSLEELNAQAWPDLTSLGIELVKKALAAHGPDRLGLKVHVGLFELWTKGYFTLLTQAGPGFMTFLASKGFGGISKVKQALEKLRKNA